MKNLLIKAASSASILIAGLALVSCLSDETRSTESEIAKNVELTTFASMFTPDSLPDCNSVCLDGDGVYYPVADSKTVSWGGKNNDNNSKDVSIRYYNTEQHFVLEVQSTNGWSDLVIDGVSMWVDGPVAANQVGTLYLDLGTGWNACDLKEFTLQVAGNGPPATFPVSYNLIGICPPCETGFTGTAISCGAEREVNYEFTSEEGASYFKMQGGLTNFTGADAVVTVTGGSEVTIGQWTPGQSSNRIISVEGAIGACETVKVNIKWNSTNSGSVITGDWSVKDAEGNPLAEDVSELTCS